MEDLMSDSTLTETVKDKYGAIARKVRAGETGSASCCGPTCCGGGDKDAISTNLYSDAEAAEVPANSIDVIISNCVINLSGNKDRVMAEAFRVLKPGGRFAVSDVVRLRDVPDDVKNNMELWIGCVAGALAKDDYFSKLETAGFVDIDVEVTREYRAAEAESFLEASGLDARVLADKIDGAFISAFIRARKP
jgi:SAM-dependent methyltransferase